jgi:hypothetical protein
LKGELIQTFAALIAGHDDIVNLRGQVMVCPKPCAGNSMKMSQLLHGHLVPGANRQAVNRLPSLGGFQVLKQKEKKG